MKNILFIILILSVSTAGAFSKKMKWKAVNGYELRYLNREIYFLELDLQQHPKNKPIKRKVNRLRQRRQELLRKK